MTLILAVNVDIGLSQLRVKMSMPISFIYYWNTMLMWIKGITQSSIRNFLSNFLRDWQTKWIHHQCVNLNPVLKKEVAKPHYSLSRKYLQSLGNYKQLFDHAEKTVFYWIQIPLSQQMFVYFVVNIKDTMLKMFL